MEFRVGQDLSGRSGLGSHTAAEEPAAVVGVARVLGLIAELARVEPEFGDRSAEQDPAGYDMMARRQLA